MMNVQAILVLTISLDDLSKYSSTIISSKDELLPQFIDIDSVHDVFMYVKLPYVSAWHPLVAKY